MEIEEFWIPPRMRPGPNGTPRANIPGEPVPRKVTSAEMSVWVPTDEEISLPPGIEEL